jgi:hypothetical protein
LARCAREAAVLDHRHKGAQILDPVHSHSPIWWKNIPHFLRIISVDLRERGLFSSRISRAGKGKRGLK